MRSVDLDENLSTVFSATGDAVVQIGPVRRQTWVPANVGVVTDSATSTQARVFVGPQSGSFYAGTFSGNRDNCPMSGIRLSPGAFLTVAWSGGTPGARATVSLTGTMEVN